MAGQPDRVSADRRGIEPDFSMGRNRPLCQLEGEGRGPCGECGEMWGRSGRAANMGAAYVWKGGRGHMWPVCTSRTSVGEREVGTRGRGGVSGESCEHWSLKKIGLKNRKGLQGGGSE